MSALRQKMLEDMQLRGFAVRTQEAYLLAVRQLARYYRKSPDQIEEEELRQRRRGAVATLAHSQQIGFLRPCSKSVQLHVLDHLLS